jgi:diguanylate cyclase (GGDEF)-like protein
VSADALRNSQEVAFSKHRDHFPGSELRALRERVRFLEAVVDNFPGGLSVFDCDLRMVVCNPRLKHMLEYPDELFANGMPTMEDLFRANAKRGEYGAGDIETHVRDRMERVREARVHAFERTRPNGRVLDVRGAPIRGGGFVTTYLDVTEQRQAQAEIAHQANHDRLTGLPNRLLLSDRFAGALARVGRGEILAVHCLDLDGFKPINDQFGHGAGDIVLKAVAGRLRQAVRATDTVARIGGDEFVVLQVDIRTPADAVVMAQRLIDAIARPFDVGEVSVRAGVSVGIAVAPLHGSSEDELLKVADAALYRAKASGRRCYRFAGSADWRGDDAVEVLRDRKFLEEGNQGAV